MMASDIFYFDEGRQRPAVGCLRFVWPSDVEQAVQADEALFSIVQRLFGKHGDRQKKHGALAMSGRIGDRFRANRPDRSSGIDSIPQPVAAETDSNSKRPRENSRRGTQKPRSEKENERGGGSSSGGGGRASFVWCRFISIPCPAFDRCAPLLLLLRKLRPVKFAPLCSKLDLPRAKVPECEATSRELHLHLLRFPHTSA